MFIPALCGVNYKLFLTTIIIIQYLNKLKIFIKKFFDTPYFPQNQFIINISVSIYIGKIYIPSLTLVYNSFMSMEIRGKIMAELNTNIEKKEVKNKIVSMILPITIENVLQMTAGFISMAIIGNIDTIAVVALGLSTRITQIVWALFKGIATGASVFVAQSFGAGDYKRLRKVVQQTLLSTIAVVILLQQFIYWNAPMLINIFNPKPNIVQSTVVYLRTVSLGLPFMAIMLVVAGVLQGMGNAKTPMKIALIMNFTNVVFSYVLIFGKLGFNPLGVKGAAISLALSQFIAAAIGLYVLFNHDGILASIGKNNFFKADFKEILNIYKVGTPTSFESIFWQIAAIILTRIILGFGETSLAAYQLGLQAESISYMPALGFSVAATTFIGQTLGAKNSQLGKIYLKELIKGSMIITSISTLILILLPGAIMGLLSRDSEVIKIGAEYLFLMGLVQIPQNLAGVLNGALRGAGYTRVPMIVAGAGLWGIRIPLSIILTAYFKFDVTAIWVVISLDMLFRFILSYTLYKSKNIYSNAIVLVEDSPSI